MAGTGRSIIPPPSSDVAPPAGGRSIIAYANKGATRNLPISSNLEGRLNDAVARVYGPGYTAQVYSGGQPGQGESGNRIGSTRHDHGRASDVYILGPDGKRVTGDGLAPLGQYWLANKYGGVGMEMRGGGIHLDEHTDRAPHWNYANQGGNYTPAMRAAMEAGTKGEMPTLYGAAPGSAPTATAAAPEAAAPVVATNAAEAPKAAATEGAPADSTAKGKSVFAGRLGEAIMRLSASLGKKTQAEVRPVYSEGPRIEAASPGGTNFVSTDTDPWGSVRSIFGGTGNG